MDESDVRVFGEGVDGTAQVPLALGRSRLVLLHLAAQRFRRSTSRPDVVAQPLSKLVTDIRGETVPGADHLKLIEPVRTGSVPG